MPQKSTSQVSDKLLLLLVLLLPATAQISYTHNDTAVTASLLIISHAPEVHLQVSHLLNDLLGLRQQLRRESQRLICVETQRFDVLAKRGVTPPT
jgi:hypothetical protein